MRLLIQSIVSIFTNGYIEGFVNGTIYRGKLKQLCVPGLNCYSCPGALGSCPIGSLQAVIGDRQYKFTFYITGFLMVVGSVLGRFVCGWLCPFGLVQDLLHKIPFVKKIRNVKFHNYLRYLKYIILLIFVIILPLFVVDIIGQGDPTFCKYICPAGTLEGGVPLVLSNDAFKDAIGFLYAWKMSILIITIILSIIIYRPFCKYICPLGAIYSVFNGISMYQYRVNYSKCIECHKCTKVCKMNIEPFKTPNHLECIRCGDCKKVCPTNAITSGFKSVDTQDKKYDLSKI
ncbi:MAG: 4Fe-4S binding protein [Clostridiales bacterium]|nr:4Fe-4S binding protein [Clostridiales bacterium]